jgi:hypothetical protein
MACGETSENPSNKGWRESADLAIAIKLIGRKDGRGFEGNALVKTAYPGGR